MAGYKQLISERQFLKVAQRARALMVDGTDLVAILYKDRQLIFKTASGTYGKRVIWTQTVEISDALLQNILAARSFHDVETLIKESDLKVHCDCPAFHYWGFQYKAWKQGYGLVKETRRPVVRNPYEKGFLCKHLYLVLSLYPFWSKALASKFRNWATSDTGAMSTQQGNKFNAPRMNQQNRQYVQQLTNPNLGPSNSTTQVNQGLQQGVSQIDNLGNQGTS